MLKKIVSLGVLLAMVFSVAACVQPDGPQADPLLEYKSAAKEELEVYAAEKGREFYSDEDWEGIMEFIADGKTAIDAAKNEAAIDSALSAAKTVIDAVPKTYGIKPPDLDDPMPEIWEWGDDWAACFGMGIDVKYATEYTIGADVLKFPMYWGEEQNLENIYVEESNPMFVSENGVVYTKSFETLIKWPAKKPVTQPKDTIKYFAARCYLYCDMPEDFELPDGTISIGNQAFAGSRNLTQLHIKQNVKTVGIYIYSGDTKEIEISAPIVYTTYFSSAAKTVIFNEGVKQIRNSESARLFELLRVQFPDTLEAIGGVPFPVNTTVESYTIPKNVKHIDSHAFDDYRAVEMPVVKRNYTTEFNFGSKYAEKRLEEVREEFGNLIIMPGPY
ncbi:MAG: leucine-rich repeat domain-containing protein [Firmicutes bacterium]|nr:leucine-rich repeat domain-containing protein [Bacillota bacterium]